MNHTNLDTDHQHITIQTPEKNCKFSAESNNSPTTLKNISRNNSKNNFKHANSNIHTYTFHISSPIKPASFALFICLVVVPFFSIIHLLPEDLLRPYIEKDENLYRMVLTTMSRKWLERT